MSTKATYRFVRDAKHENWGRLEVRRRFTLFGYHLFDYWELVYDFVQASCWVSLADRHAKAPTIHEVTIP